VIAQFQKKKFSRGTGADEAAPHSRRGKPSTKTGGNGRPQVNVGLEVGLLYGQEKHLALSLSRPIERHAEGKGLGQIDDGNGNEIQGRVQKRRASKACGMEGDRAQRGSVHSALLCDI
jgi:hypothetical protein